MTRKRVLKRREREREKRVRVSFKGGGYPGSATLFFMVHSMFFLVFFEVVGAVLRGMDQIPATVA